MAYVCVFDEPDRVGEAGRVRTKGFIRTVENSVLFLIWFAAKSNKIQSI